MRFSNSVFFINFVVPSPLIHTLKYFYHLLRFHGVIGLLKKSAFLEFLNLHDSIHGDFWISVYWDTKIQILCVFYTRRFFNLHVLKHGDWNIWTVCLTKPPCFNIWRFLNLRVLKYGDSKISVFKPRIFLNLHVLKHGD